MDTGEIVSWEMCPRLVAGHVSSSGAEVKDTWSYTTTPFVYKEKFTFLLLIIKPIDALISQIYFWNKTLHISESSLSITRSFSLYT